MAKEEPKLIDVNVSVSLGGKVEILDYGKLTSDFHVSESERWDVSSMSEEDALKFRAERREQLFSELEAVAQREQDWRVEWRNQEQDKQKQGK